MDRIWKYLLIIVTIVISDQLTKAYIQQEFSLGESIPIIDGFFSFTYVKNPGAAFGLGATSSQLMRNIFFKALPVVACLWLVKLIWDTRKGSFLEGVSYSLILSGAIGNLWDRFAHNYVVDFLDFYIGDSHFPAFNIADSAISVAAGLLIINFYFQWKEEQEGKKQEETS